MFCALLGQDIRRAFTGPLALWFSDYYLRGCENVISSRLCSSFRDYTTVKRRFRVVYCFQPVGDSVIPSIH